MFPNAKSLVALHVIFLLASMASASPVDITTGIEGMSHDFLLAILLKFYLARGNENHPDIGKPVTLTQVCRESKGINEARSFWYIKQVHKGPKGSYETELDKCVSGRRCVLDPTCFSSFNISHLLPRCMIINGEGKCVV
jgi:hypothetical protein